MRSSTFLFLGVLGFLPSSLSAAIGSVFSSLEKPFTLRANTTEREHLVLGSFEGFSYFFAEISHNTTGIPKFTLKNGNLTTSDGLQTAFFPSNVFPHALFPPPPLPLAFGNVAREGAPVLTSFTPEFTATTVSTPSGRFKLQLLPLLGRKFETATLPFVFFFSWKRKKLHFIKIEANYVEIAFVINDAFGDIVLVAIPGSNINTNFTTIVSFDIIF